MNDRRRLKLTTAYLFAFMASFALSSTMFSTVLPKMIEDFHLSLSMAGLLPMCTSVGNLIAMALTGLVGDRASSFAMLLAALLLLGVCTSSLNLMLTAYVSDIYGERRSRYINLLHVCFGIGSLVGPLYPTALGAAGLSWRFAYMMLAVVVLILSAAYFLTLRRLGAPASFAGANASAAPKEAGGAMGLLRSPSVWMLGIVSFLYMGGHQNAFSTWFQTHLQQANAALYPESLTSACMTIYWIGMVISRLIGSALPQKFSSRSIILRSGNRRACRLGCFRVFAWHCNRCDLPAHLRHLLRVVPFQLRPGQQYCRRFFLAGQHSIRVSDGVHGGTVSLRCALASCCSAVERICHCPSVHEKPSNAGYAQNAGTDGATMTTRQTGGMHKG